MEHYICNQDENGNPAYREATQEELDALNVVQSDWLHDYPIRIVAPKELALQYPEIYVWFQLNGLPVEPNGDSVYLYCNEILPEHKEIVERYGAIIEYKP